MLHPHAVHPPLGALLIPCAMRGTGASLMWVGWHAKKWDAYFFRVVDVAERLGSGVGSFGVGRYYVLLAGYDTDLKAEADGALDTSIAGGIILDVKSEPRPHAVHCPRRAPSLAPLL